MIRFVHAPQVCYGWYQPSTYPMCIMGGISCSQYTQGEPMDALIMQAAGVLQESFCHAIVSCCLPIHALVMPSIS